MPETDLSNVAIVWTSDMTDYKRSIVSAVNECAGVIPGFRFHIVGTECIAPSLLTDADSVIQKSVHMNKHRGWIPDPFTAAAALAKTIQSEVPERYDLIVAFTRSGIDHTDIHGSLYEYYKDGAGIISLDSCKTAHDHEAMAALMLEHVLGHALRHDGLLIHCQKEACAMTCLTSDRVIQNLIACKGTKPDLSDIFCEQCLESFHESPLWCNRPSVVIRNPKNI